MPLSTFHPTPAARRSAILAARVDASAARLLEALERSRWNPDQPRIPAGETGGGRWTDGNGSWTGGDRPPRSDRIRVADASGKVPQSVLDELARRIDVADAKFENALRRASSGVEISRAEEERARLAIAEKALAQVGSTDWTPGVAKDNFPAGSNKCNLFVYDMLKDVEADPPLANGGVMYNVFGVGVPTYPVLAGQWADDKVTIPRWSIVTGKPEIGDVIATRTRDPMATGWTGHTGIFVGFDGARPRTVSATDAGVSLGEWPFRSGDLPYRIRRYHAGRAP